VRFEKIPISGCGYINAGRSIIRIFTPSIKHGGCDANNEKNDDAEFNRLPCKPQYNDRSYKFFSIFRAQRCDIRSQNYPQGSGVQLWNKSYGSIKFRRPFKSARMAFAQ